MTTQVITQNIDSNVKGMRAVMRGALGGRVEILNSQILQCSGFLKGFKKSRDPKMIFNIKFQTLQVGLFQSGKIIYETIINENFDIGYSQLLLTNYTKIMDEMIKLLNNAVRTKNISKLQGIDGTDSLKKDRETYVQICNALHTVTRDVEADAFNKVIHELKNTPKLYEPAFNQVFTLERFWVLARLKDTPYSLGEINFAGRGSNEDIDRGGRHDKK